MEGKGTEVGFVPWSPSLYPFPVPPVPGDSGDHDPLRPLLLQPDLASRVF